MTTLATSPTWFSTPTTTVLADLRRGGLRVPYPLAQAFAADLAQVERLRSTLVGQGVPLPPAALQLIETIKRATVAVDLRWSPQGGGPDEPHPELGAVGLLAQDRAALICVTGPTARVAQVAAHGALAALLSCLPPLPPAQISPLAYPVALAAELDALALRDHPVPADSALLRELGTSWERLSGTLRTLHRPMATGQLGVTFDGPHGERRGAQTLGLFDSPAGRAMVRTSRHGDGEPWITITSATQPQLLRAAAELLGD